MSICGDFDIKNVIPRFRYEPLEAKDVAYYSHKDTKFTKNEGQIISFNRYSFPTLGQQWQPMASSTEYKLERLS